MKWHLFKKDDPNTYPEIDCPMLVYAGNFKGNEMFYICKWGDYCDFKELDGMSWYFDECYYAYIGYVPSGYKVFNPIVCTNKKHGYTCDEYDDGYCIYRDLHPNCKYQKEVNEYGIEVKAIWKEFEE